MTLVKPLQGIESVGHDLFYNTLSPTANLAKGNIPRSGYSIVEYD